jgi:hypothetical protein
MHLRVRFIGKALEYLHAQGHDDRRYPLQQVPPELVHVGDLVRHPLFPGRNVYVVAREVDLVDRCVTVWLDELPGGSSDLAGLREASPSPAQACALQD